MKAREKVTQILMTSKELSKVCKSINTSWYNKSGGDPQITIKQISSSVINNHDNKVDLRVVLIQIDIWSKGNPFIIGKKVQQAMDNYGYEYADERELNEEDMNRLMILYKILET